MSNGVIYIVRNDFAHKGYPNLYKIGMTERTSLKARLRSLNADSTNIGKFYEIAHVFTRDVKEVERLLFIALHEYRVQPNREFFDCKIDVLVNYMMEVVGDRLLDSSIPSTLHLTKNEVGIRGDVIYSEPTIIKIDNFDVVDQWLYKLLSFADNENQPEYWRSVPFGSIVAKKDFFDKFKKRPILYNELNHPPVDTAEIFWKRCRKYKTLIKDAGFVTIRGKRFRHIRISSLEDCRDAFNRFHGIEIILKNNADQRGTG